METIILGAHYSHPSPSVRTVRIPYMLDKRKGMVWFVEIGNESRMRQTVAEWQASGFTAVTTPTPTAVTPAYTIPTPAAPTAMEAYAQWLKNLE